MFYLSHITVSRHLQYLKTRHFPFLHRSRVFIGRGLAQAHSNSAILRSNCMVGFVLEKDETVTAEIPSLFETCDEVTIALSNSRDTRITFPTLNLSVS